MGRVADEIDKLFSGELIEIEFSLEFTYSFLFFQICLHFNILYDSILWTRSAQKSGCMICRKKVDPGEKRRRFFKLISINLINLLILRTNTAL